MLLALYISLTFISNQETEQQTDKETCKNYKQSILCMYIQELEKKYLQSCGLQVCVYIVVCMRVSAAYKTAGN